MIRAAVVLAALVAFAFAESTYTLGEKKPIIPTPGKYHTKGGPVEGKLNVHLVCHTHVRCFHQQCIDDLTLFFTPSGRCWLAEDNRRVLQ